MAAALPIVATRGGSVGDAVEDGVTGILCPPGSAAALEDAMLLLGRDEGLRRRLGERGRAVVRKKFAPERELHETLEVYRRVLDAPR
jgi:glycosyltransferase involved in cell wall biosynthesis